MSWHKVLAVTFIIPLLGVGCTDKIVESVKEVLSQGAQKGGELIFESGAGFVRNLTAEQKRIIDEWLALNSLNQYGDVIGTFYAGGTPLFNEFTGETKDRFVHLFEKFPELKDIIKTKE